jgi:hypothetical protein
LAARTAGADLVRFAEVLRAEAVAFALAVFRRFTDFAASDCDDLAVRCPRSPSFDEFLRDFLDIRLPFVAFAGSIIAVLKDLSAGWNQFGGWARAMASEYV